MSRLFCALMLICVALCCGCKSDQQQDSVLKEAVVRPIEKAKDVSADAEKRDKELTRQLDEATAEDD